MVKIRVPATSANIGPGFDALGIAFNMYNDYEFELTNLGIEFQGVEEAYQNDDNIILVSMKKVFDKYGFQVNGIRIKIQTQNIPVSRGLGSSSSCIVAGLFAAFALMNKDIDKAEVLQLATEIEGHPDNVCPAIFGGMVVSVIDSSEVIYNNIYIKPGVKFVALIPKFELSTKEARAILPEQISLKDGVFNVGRVALLISCLQNGNYKLLKTATKDRFHEDYRSELIQGYNEIYDYCYEAGALGCFLSGAGPTLMTICNDDDKEIINKIRTYIATNSLLWGIEELAVDYDGAKIL